MKDVFPCVKRQHSNGPYSYCGLKCKKKSKNDIASIEKVDERIVAAEIAIDHCKPKVNDVINGSEEVHLRSVACQAIEASPYDCPQNHFFKIPKEKFLDRSLLHSVDGEKVPLGEGTFAIVHTMLYKRMYVAVKEYKEHHQFTLKTIKERVIREARTMISISPHESIPILFGLIIHSRPFCLVSQLCSRHNKCLTLLRLVRGKAEKLAEEELVSVLAKLADALHHLHVNGFVHNDLKLDNVALIKSQTAASIREWIPMILDFGEATLLAANVKKRYSLPHSHIDPLVNSGSVAHSVCSDVFSLGVIIRRVAELTTTQDIQDNLLGAHLLCTSDIDKRPNAKAVAIRLKSFCNSLS
eukprot:Seg117.3 transcript_id=Seg117.3/GoldUCD/mRNA.D3Y31 product="Tyrosine-protein kinase TXK" protein_id=Seg117.3/GoldUCD/D3Y31